MPGGHVWFGCVRSIAAAFHDGFNCTGVILMDGLAPAASVAQECNTNGP